MVRPSLYWLGSCLDCSVALNNTGSIDYPDVSLRARSQWFRAVVDHVPARQGPAQGPQARRQSLRL